MPESYGLRPAEAGLLPWSGVTEKLAAARTYWVATTRPDGRPHAVPVWGLWLDGVFYFGTERRSRKARNLAANPAVAVHLPSGDDAVMLEGAASPVTEPARLAAFDDAYFDKYAVRMRDIPGALSVWAVRPRVALAWQEKDFPGTATRWTLEDRA
jgi:pyridoxine/pyridoxamine 5'-phosphate oxidase